MHISRELTVDRRTIYKWEKLEEIPRRRLSVRTNIALYESEIRNILSEQPDTTIFAIWQNIKALGYNGGQVTACRQIGYVAGKKANYIPKLASAFWQPSKAGLMLCTHPDKLSEKEEEMIKCLSKRSKEIRLAAKLVKDFRVMIKKRGDLLAHWIDRAIASDVKELSGVARGMLGDMETIQNALSMNWSNGQVKGQVNKLKTIKRQMYGRASFELLRKRLVHQSAWA
jgi:hypothetical protein